MKSKTSISDEHKLVVGGLEDLLSHPLYEPVKARPLTGETNGKIAYEFGVKSGGVWHLGAILSLHKNAEQVRVRLFRPHTQITEFDVHYKDEFPQDEILSKLICDSIL